MDLTSIVVVSNIIYIVSVCGGILTNPTEYISSIGYPNGNYSNNEECIWVIQNQNVTDSTIMLKFVDFDLESHPDCHYDFIEVREGEICTQAAARVVIPPLVERGLYRNHLVRPSVHTFVTDI